MPTAKATKRKPSVIHPDAIDSEPSNAPLTDEELSRPGEWEGEWYDQIKTENLNIWDAMAILPRRAQEQECLMYLYRLEPRVVNQQQESYIEKYPANITIDKVKQDHGGGKYQVYLKRDRRKLMELKFWIDGPPKFQLGQTLVASGERVGPGAAVATPTATRSEMAEVVKEVINAGNTKGQDAALEIMTSGFKRVLDMQASAADSATGSKLGDAIFPKLLERMMTPPPPPPTIAEQLAALGPLIELLKPKEAPAPPPAPPPVDLTEQMDKQLGIVTKMLGVDSFSELLENRGRAQDAAPWWAGLATKLLEVAPGLVDKWSQTTIHVANVGRRLTPARPGTPPTITATAVPQTTEAQPQPSAQPSPAQSQQEAITYIVNEVCRAFDAGFDGFETAAHLQLAMPQAIGTFAPLLGDAAQLKMFIQTVPPLAARAQEHPKDWQEFQEEFIKAFQPQAEPEPEKATVAPESAA